MPAGSVSRLVLCGSTALACWALLATTATAQAVEESAFARDRNVNVRERPRPEYDTLGVRRGAFLIFPKVEISLAFEDNVFAEEEDPEQDAVVNFIPSVRAESQWSRHQVRAGLQLSTFQYGRFDTNNNTTYSANASGRLDVVRGTAVTGAVSLDHLVESRTSPSSPLEAVDPIEFDRAAFDIGASREVNRIRISGALHFQDYEYENARSFEGELIDEQFRNHTIAEQEVRVDYAISPALAVYGNAARNDWTYKEPDPSGVRRDASGYQLAVGADFDLTQLTRGRVQAGYLSQSFDDPRVEDVSGLGFLAQVEYFPTPLLTVAVNAERSVVPTGVIGAGAVVRGALGAVADYEFRRNIIITARTQYAADDYRGLDREDRILSATIGAAYLLNRRVGLNAVVSHYRQDSEGAFRGRRFSANRVQLGFVYQL